MTAPLPAAWHDPIARQRALEARVSQLEAEGEALEAALAVFADEKAQYDAVIAEVIRDGERHGGRAAVKPLVRLRGAA